MSCVCRKKRAEAEAKRRLQYAQNIAKIVDAAEEQINAHARKLKAADKKKAEKQVQAQQEQSRQQKVATQVSLAQSMDLEVVSL